MTMGYGAGAMPEKVRRHDASSALLRKELTPRLRPATQMSDTVLECQAAADCLLPMGITSKLSRRRLGLGDLSSRADFISHSHS